jgi:hypothetical protein
LMACAGIRRRGSGLALAEAHGSVRLPSDRDRHEPGQWRRRGYWMRGGLRLSRRVKRRMEWSRAGQVGVCTVLRPCACLTVCLSCACSPTGDSGAEVIKTYWFKTPSSCLNPSRSGLDRLNTEFGIRCPSQLVSQCEDPRRGGSPHAENSMTPRGPSRHALQIPRITPT